MVGKKTYSLCFQLEEQTALTSSGKFKWSEKTKRESAWDKERSDHQRTVTEYQNLVRDLEARVRTAERCRDRDQQDLMGKLDSARRNMDRENNDLRKRCTQVRGFVVLLLLLLLLLFSCCCFVLFHAVVLFYFMVLFCFISCCCFVLFHAVVLFYFMVLLLLFCFISCCCFVLFHVVVFPCCHSLQISTGGHYVDQFTISHNRGPVLNHINILQFNYYFDVYDNCFI